MFGRYSITTNFEAIRQIFGTVGGGNWWRPRYNVAPTQLAPVVCIGDGQRELVELRWGLIPFWAKDRKIAYKTINARAETVATAPAFREAFKTRRCLVLTTGFYEWQPTGGRKQPYMIGMNDRSPFALAGLWESWKGRATAETIESFTVIVGPPNSLVEPIHDRMPVIIGPADYDRWLTAPEPPIDLLRPYPAEAMESFPVSTLVNNPKNEDPQCIEPIEGV